MTDEPVFHDDESIGGAEILFKHVKLAPSCIIYCNELKRLRPASSLFSNTPIKDQQGKKMGEHYMSVYFESVLNANAIAPAKIVENQERSLLKISCEEVRAIGTKRTNPQAIVKDPRNPPPDYAVAHGGVAGKKTAGIQKDLASACRWLVKPEVQWIQDNRERLGIPDGLDIAENYKKLVGEESSN